MKIGRSRFEITTGGKDLPFVRIDVNLCETIRYGNSRNYDKIFTIDITGLGNIKNGLYKLILSVIYIRVVFGVDCAADCLPLIDGSPEIDDGFEEEDDLLGEVFFCIYFIVYLSLNKGFYNRTMQFSLRR